MTDDDKLRFASAMEALGRIYRREIDATTKRLYFDACRGITIEQFEGAVGLAIRTNKFFPTPSELIQHGDPLALALEAYMLADRTMAKYGSYRAVDFADKAINATIRSLGGWDAFGSVKMSEERRYRDEFVRTYMAFSKSAIGDEAGAPLIGLAEATDVKRDNEGRVIEQRLHPMRIGAVEENLLESYSNLVESVL